MEEQSHAPYRLNRRDAGAVLAILAAAICFYAWLWPNAPQLVSDSGSYMRLGREMLNLKLEALSLRTPGFPLFLILTQATEQPTRLFYFGALALHMASVALLAYLCAVLRIPRWVILVFIVLAILPPYVEPCASVLAEAVSQFTVVFSLGSLVLWLLERRARWLIVFLVMVPLAGQVRPTYVLMGLLFIGCVGVLGGLRMWPAERPRALVVGLVVATIVSFGTQMAWSYCNYAAFGYFGANRLQVFQLGTKTYDYVEALPDEHKALREILVRHRDANMLEPFGDHTGKDFLYRAFPEVQAYYGGDVVTTTVQLTKVLSGLIKQKPMSYLNNSLRSFSYFWTPNECMVCEAQPKAVRLAWVGLQMLVLAMFFCTAFALAGAGLVYALAFCLSGRTLAALPDVRARVVCLLWMVSIALVLYTGLVSSFIGTGLPRYRQTVDLLVLLCATAGLVTWRDLSQWLVMRVKTGTAGNPVHGS